MNGTDTVDLLQQVSKGLHMAIFSFDDLIGDVRNPALRKVLEESRDDHKRLLNENSNILKGYHQNDRDIGAMTKLMAHMSADMKLDINYSDRVIANIITKGCDTGIRNLRKYVNEYAASDLAAVDTARKLVTVEENLKDNIAMYL